MKLRIARHTDQLAQVTAFYRDRVGLEQIGDFKDHAGYHGIFLEVPGTGAHLEFTTGGQHAAPQPHPESLLVLYFDSQAELDEVAGRIGQQPVSAANPYWTGNAVAFADPDGFLLLLALGR